MDEMNPDQIIHFCPRYQYVSRNGQSTEAPLTSQSCTQVMNQHRGLVGYLEGGKPSPLQMLMNSLLPANHCIVPVWTGLMGTDVQQLLEDCTHITQVCLILNIFKYLMFGYHYFVCVCVICTKIVWFAKQLEAKLCSQKKDLIKMHSIY